MSEINDYLAVLVRVENHRNERVDRVDTLHILFRDDVVDNYRVHSSTSMRRSFCSRENCVRKFYSSLAEKARYCRESGTRFCAGELSVNCLNM